MEAVTAGGLRTWREKMKLTQQHAAEVFNVSRATIANWELGVTPIHHLVEPMCRIYEQSLKMRDDFGPVTLVYADGPLWQNPYGPSRIPNLHRELYPNNATAIGRAMDLIDRPDVFNMFIVEEGGDFVWNGVELRRECERRRA